MIQTFISQVIKIFPPIFIHSELVHTRCRSYENIWNKRNSTGSNQARMLILTMADLGKPASQGTNPQWLSLSSSTTKTLSEKSFAPKNAMCISHLLLLKTALKIHRFTGFFKKKLRSFRIKKKMKSGERRSMSHLLWEFIPTSSALPFCLVLAKWTSVRPQASNVQLRSSMSNWDWFIWK